MFYVDWSWHTSTFLDEFWCLSNTRDPEQKICFASTHAIGPGVFSRASQGARRNATAIKHLRRTTVALGFPRRKFRRQGGLLRILQNPSGEHATFIKSTAKMPGQRHGRSHRQKHLDCQDLFLLTDVEHASTARSWKRWDPKWSWEFKMES